MSRDQTFICLLTKFHSAAEKTENIAGVVDEVQQQASNSQPLEIVKEEAEEAFQESEQIVKNSLAQQTPQIALTA